jgi:hypothetical protein
MPASDYKRDAGISVYMQKTMLIRSPPRGAYLWEVT